MKVVIDIPEKIYNTIMDDEMLSREQLAVLQIHILKGTLLPIGHGRLIDADALYKKMYNEAFETDSELQKWESGCWIRFKMFENHIDTAPTIIEAESEGEDEG